MNAKFVRIMVHIERIIGTLGRIMEKFPRITEQNNSNIGKTTTTTKNHILLWPSMKQSSISFYVK